ncbi:MAG: sigma-70 family RNA polymerase sigma factor [Planctomycetota bacterium]
MDAGSQFATTQWTQILLSQGESTEARVALNQLCTSYYVPVQTFIRCSLQRGESADDLTQEFFTRILTGRAFANIDPDRGRFRSYLLGAVKHFLSDKRDRERAIKRGGGASPISLDSVADASGIDVADPNAPSPEAAFEKQWALTLLDRALDQLRNEMTEAAKAPQFETLKPWLTGNIAESQAAAAVSLGMNENAVKVAIHRLRRRFKDLVTLEIARTVTDPSDQDAELADLIKALSR